MRFYSVTSFDDQLGDPRANFSPPELYKDSELLVQAEASRVHLSLVGPEVFEKVSPGYWISHYDVKLFAGE